ncbi:MAG: sigma-70 family RNA polymerase sigma factor [Spirochaetes bacterium]|nr:sigma-70 family RNA polymerase sigma factor [Spirochaetota bacterium]
MTERIIIKNKAEKREEDFELIKEFLANGGSRTAFNRLVLKYKDMVFNLCFRMLGDYDDANDCAQEIFIKVFNNLKGFKFESGFATWLYRISVNTCKNNLSSLTSRMKRKMTSLDDPGNANDPSNITGHRINGRDNSDNPARLYEKKEREAIIQRAVDSLKAKDKILVVLRDIEGRSYEEIAAITELNMGTVKSRLARARQELRERLKGVI